MADTLKREVRARSHQRLVRKGRGKETVLTTSRMVSTIPCSSLQGQLVRDISNNAACLTAVPPACNPALSWTPSCEAILLSFYLDSVLPFLLPFYEPDYRHQGGRTWISEMITNSPVYRRIALCQSSHFFALTQGTDSIQWDAVLAQANDMFGLLRHAIETLNRSGVHVHLQGAVRILTGLMQMQRFEVFLTNFKNCRAHHEAALGLFREILAVQNQRSPSHAPKKLISGCIFGPPTSMLGIKIPNSTQAALHFSSALLLLDDTIASIILRETPKLYEYHESFLESVCDDIDDTIQLENFFGCPNWVLIEMGKIAALNASRHESQDDSLPETSQFSQTVAEIHRRLDAKLAAHTSHGLGANIPQNLITDVQPTSRRDVAQIWAYTAVLQLMTVVHGILPNEPEIQANVRQVIALLNRVSSPRLLRGLAWPFFIVGCLASGDLKLQFRNMTAALMHQRTYNTLVEVARSMECVWNEREAHDGPLYDPWAFLKIGTGFVLLM